MVSGRKLRRSMIWLALLAELAACGRFGGAAHPPEGGMRIRFEDKAEPSVFALEASAVRDRKDGAAGLWAAVKGLPRPERGLVVNTATGNKVVVALFSAPPDAASPVRLSNDAADVVGIGDRPTEVRITALRREPRLDTTRGRF